MRRARARLLTVLAAGLACSLAAVAAVLVRHGDETEMPPSTPELVGKYRAGWESRRFSYRKLSNDALRTVAADLEQMWDGWRQDRTSPETLRRLSDEASTLYDFAVSIPQQNLALLLICGEVETAAALVESYRDELALRDAHPASRHADAS